MDKNIKITSTRLLAVEGKDECNFFNALLKHLLISDVQMVDIGGKDKFHREFSLLYNLEGFGKIEQLAFIRDAETNLAKSAFDSICDLLKKKGLSVPKWPNKIQLNVKPYIGIFIMPDNSGTGMLENLCLKTIESLPQYAPVLMDLSPALFNTSHRMKKQYSMNQRQGFKPILHRVHLLSILWGLVRRRDIGTLSIPALARLKTFLRQSLP